MGTIERVRKLRDEFQVMVEKNLTTTSTDKFATRIRDELDTILKDLQKCLN